MSGSIRHLMAGTEQNSAARRRRRSPHCLPSGTWKKLPAPSASATRTLLRWLKEPEFQTAYREARRAAFGQSIARLQQASSAAVTTLLKVMVDPNTPASTRVRAADSVLDHSAKAIEIEDIEARVSELERRPQRRRQAKRDQINPYRENSEK